MKKDELSGFISGIYDGLDDIINAVARRVGVDPKYLKAVAATESNLGRDLRLEPIGDTKGITHVTYGVAKYYSPNLKQGDQKNLSTEADLEIGAKFLKDLMKKYGSIELAAKAYNGGEPRLNQIIKYNKSLVFSPITKTDTLAAMKSAESNMNIHWTKFKKNLDKIGVA